jgi:sterol desaturase/sphingolipid hydroxylase (fatty acid hydroxylase superfamily)
MILLKYEINRYRNKGYGIIFGMMILFAFFYFYPIICRGLYPLLLKYVDGKLVFSFITPILHILVFSLSNLFLQIIYSSENTWIEQFKCNKNSWPWIDDKENWARMINKSRKTLFLNLLVVGPILSILMYFFSFANIETSVDLIPSAWDLSRQIFICVLLNDFSFHFTHKLLHSKFFYQTIHYIHHEYNNPIGITSEYAHPLEYIFSNILPASLGPLVLHNEIHVLGIWAWLIFGICATVEQHSGYEFPFSPFGIFPFSFASSYHDYHHTRYKYNYSSNFVFWDYLFGDNKEYLAFYEKKLKNQK